MQSPSKPSTRYEVLKMPTIKDGYAQRIEIWKAVQQLGSANRTELLHELRRANHQRPNNARVDEAYCRIELTDMCKRGFLKRIQD